MSHRLATQELHQIEQPDPDVREPLQECDLTNTIPSDEQHDAELSDSQQKQFQSNQEYENGMQNQHSHYM